MRLFIAIELSDQVRERLLRLEDALRAGLAQESRAVSWVKSENLHVTLKFLGEVQEAQVPGLCDALASVRPVGEIPLAAARIECLPRRGPLRVIAAGLEGELERLADLHRDIEDKCANLGFPPENRKFLPHITFARVKRRLRASTRQIEQCAAAILPTDQMTVTEFVLMQSQLKPHGAEYARVARFPIGQ